MRKNTGSGLHRKTVKRCLAFIMVFILTALPAAGCASKEDGEKADSKGTASSSQEGDGITVTDMTGAKVHLEAPAERVVAVTASDCEILYAAGAGDTLVGRGEYCDYPEEALEIKSVNSGTDLNIEQILALEPDLVLMNEMDQSKDQVDALKSAGLAVAESNAADIAGVYESVSMIGALTGHEEEAAEVVSGMKAAFEKIQADVPEDAGEKTVYFEVSPLQYGLWTAGSGTFMNEIAEMLGMKNAFADVEGWAEISEEQVLERDPDYIVTITMYDGEGETPVDEILGRDGWSGLKAVKNGAVFNADSNEVSRPGPRLKDAAESLYDFFYRK